MQQQATVERDVGPQTNSMDLTLTPDDAEEDKDLAAYFLHKDASEPVVMYEGNEGDGIPHWFYYEDNNWVPFSYLDSTRIEEGYNSSDTKIVATNGGRFDVHLDTNQRKSVYWESPSTTVKRCLWFYKCDKKNAYFPYTEDVAQRLEELYASSLKCNEWDKKYKYSETEMIVLHSPTRMIHYVTARTPDVWGTTSTQNNIKFQTVKRGGVGNLLPDVKKGEDQEIDHLVMVVHGIGEVCDIKFRNLVQCLDDMRQLSNELIKSHFKTYYEEKKITRIEFLPILWHDDLHNENLENTFENISLPSISKIRNFINNSLTDILLYSSPIYCQKIVNIVSSQLNEQYRLFMERNSDFSGTISLMGHSLGTIIIFDLLYHQPTDAEQSPPHPRPDQDKNFTEEKLEDILEKIGGLKYIDVFEKEELDGDSLILCSEDDLKVLDIPIGIRVKLLAYLKEKNTKKFNTKFKSSDFPILTGENSNGTEIHLGQQNIIYNKLNFQPVAFFALGSPIGMFLATRGFRGMDSNYNFPTCKKFYNIFHPIDPIAYRLETFIKSDFSEQPVLIPHHKGRKRFHLEFIDGINHMSANLKNKLYSVIGSTLHSINSHFRSLSIGGNKKLTSLALEQPELDKASPSTPEEQEPDILEDYTELLGNLNQGKRIDYVLQERPVEIINEYLSAVTSHTCYWESEDTVLLIISQIYKTDGFFSNLERRVSQET